MNPKNANIKFIILHIENSQKMNDLSNYYKENWINYLRWIHVIIPSNFMYQNKRMAVDWVPTIFNTQINFIKSLYPKHLIESSTIQLNIYILSLLLTLSLFLLNTNNNHHHHIIPTTCRYMILILLNDDLMFFQRQRIWITCETQCIYCCLNIFWAKGTHSNCGM